MATVTALHPSLHAGTPIPAQQIPHTSLPSVDSSSSINERPNLSGPVVATLNFYQAPSDGSPPHNYVEKPTDGRPQRNFGDAATPTTLQDIRGRENTFSLARDAFAALTAPSPTNPSIDWDSDASVKKLYYPEVESLLLANIPGATRVLLFDHTVRRADPASPRNPVTRVHVDQTPKSTAARVRHHLPAPEAEEALKGRYRIVNVWRPINGAVESFPLAFAAAGSVSDEDMVAVEHRYPDRNGETAAVRHGEGQSWFYWSRMEEDERLLLQCADSRDWGSRVPHSAFVDPRSGEGAKRRESIEVRALVFG